MHLFYKLIDDYQNTAGSNWEKVTDLENRKVSYIVEEG